MRWRSGARKGNPGGPRRPFGSLSGVKAPLAFLRDVVRYWDQYGEATLTQLILTDPVRYALLMSAIAAGDLRVRRRRHGDRQDRSAQTTGVTDRPVPTTRSPVENRRHLRQKPV
jgi:hypothetical protein